jgi:hypothetical protein
MNAAAKLTQFPFAIDRMDFWTELHDATLNLQYEEILSGTQTRRAV